MAYFNVSTVSLEELRKTKIYSE